MFQVASACGLGALEAASERGIWGIGVGVDQSHLGQHILTSAVKRMDVAVFDTIEALVRGTLEAPSLYDEFLRLLARAGYPIPAGVLERDVTKAWTTEGASLPQRGWLGAAGSPKPEPAPSCAAPGSFGTCRAPRTRWRGGSPPIT